MTAITTNYYTSTYLPAAKPAVQVRSVGTSDGSAAATTTTGVSGTTDEPFSQVALDARASLDAGYQKLGKVADDSTTGEEWSKTVGLDSLDRRTLYAIASNQGGLFSQDEMMAAQFTMGQQEAAAMTAANPLTQDPAAGYKAAIDFLDTVSPEEKSSLSWAQQRGTAQAGYVETTKEAGGTPADVDSGNPIVNLFAKAYDELSASNDPTQSVHNMPSWQKALDLWDLQSDDSPSISLTL